MCASARASSSAACGDAGFDDGVAGVLERQPDHIAHDLLVVHHEHCPALMFSSIVAAPRSRDPRSGYELAARRPSHRFPTGGSWPRAASAARCPDRRAPRRARRCLPSSCRSLMQQLVDPLVERHGALPALAQREALLDQRPRRRRPGRAHDEVVARDRLRRRARARPALRLARATPHRRPRRRIAASAARAGTARTRSHESSSTSRTERHAKRDEVVEDVRRVPVVERREQRTGRPGRAEEHRARRLAGDGVRDRVDADPVHGVSVVHVVADLDAEQPGDEQREHDEAPPARPARDREAAGERRP